MCFQIFENQQATVQTLLDNVNDPDKKRYQLLVAQMQSGKSGIFICFAIEMMIIGNVNTVYIITGSRDINLRSQLRNDLNEAIHHYIPIEKKELQKKIIEKQTEIEKIEIEKDVIANNQNRNNDGSGNRYIELDQYIRVINREIDELKKDIDKIDSSINNMKSKIHILFSQDIKKNNHINFKDFLIIHDESHYAQSKDNIPYNYLYEKNDLEHVLHGDFSELERRNIFVVSVSATPLSELSANTTNFNGKTVVLSKPGSNYKGVQHFKNHNKIKYIKDFSDNPLENIIKQNFGNSRYVGNVYIIVRTHTKKDLNDVKRISKQYNHDYINIFSKSEYNFDILKNKPVRPTIVHICNLARMGQRLPLEHIGVAIELGARPKTDTILQGLLGRLCGYYANRNDENLPIIHISHHVEMDIEKYIQGWEDLDESYITKIKNATNIKSTKSMDSIEIDMDGNMWVKIIPYKLTHAQCRWEQELREDIPHNDVTTSIHQIISDDSFVHNNSYQDIQHVREYLESNSEREIFSFRKDNDNSYATLKEKLDKAISNSKRFTHNFNNCITTNKTVDVKPFILFKCDDVTYFMGYVPYHKNHHRHVLEYTSKIIVKDKCNFI